MGIGVDDPEGTGDAIGHKTENDDRSECLQRAGELL